MNSFTVNRGYFVTQLSNKIIKHAEASRGILFGGVPRTKAIHDPAADAFYAKCNEGVCEKRLYDDEEHDPETFHDRTLTYRDIDIFFTCATDANEFNERLKNDRELFIKKTKNYKNYLRGIGGGTVKIDIDTKRCTYKLPWACRIQMGGSLEMKVDIITGPSGMAPPFNVDLDLECNGLLLNKGQYELMSCLSKGLDTPHKRFMKLKDVLENIRNKKTYIVSENIPMYRIQKMAMRWEIHGVRFMSCPCRHKESKDDLKDKECFICHEPIEQIYIGMTCCSGKMRMHGDCGFRWLNTNLDIDKCPGCNSGLKICNKDKSLILAIGLMTHSHHRSRQE